MTVLTYNDIVRKAKQIKQNVENNQELGDSPKWSYYFAMTVLNPRKNIPVKSFRIQKKNTGNNFSRQIKKSDYVDMAKRFTKYVEYNKRLPNNIKVRDKLMRVTDYTYMFAWIVVFYDVKGKLPSIVPVNSKLFIKPTEPSNVVLNAFIKAFGKVITFTDALRKVDGKGYGYYFEDELSNLEVIDGLEEPDGEKPNCVDICQMMWNVAIGLGYEVRCLQVYCPVDDITHVRLQVKHDEYTNGEWEDYDPAAVADGDGLYTLWCNGSGSYIIATNPYWFMQNIHR